METRLLDKFNHTLNKRDLRRVFRSWKKIWKNRYNTYNSHSCKNCDMFGTVFVVIWT